MGTLVTGHAVTTGDNERRNFRSRNSRDGIVTSPGGDRMKG